jgi:hypothetical protein
MSLNVAVFVCALCLGRSLLAVLVVRPCLLVVIFVVASCWLSGGDVESSVSVTSTRAHTLTQKKKTTGLTYFIGKLAIGRQGKA